MRENPTGDGAGQVQLDAIASRIVDAATRAAALPPDAATFLLRCYIASPADLTDALGVALARALDEASCETGANGRARWLTLFVEAAPIVDDDRIRGAAVDLVDLLRATWPGDAATADGFAACAASIDACLRASTVVGVTTIVPPAIDELERIVGATYRPGDGVVGGAPAAHVAASSMLLTAFELTGRVPYPMLAEELMQPARRDPPGDWTLDCAAARVLCRLAALHADPGYRAAAVMAPGADYRGDAARILRSYASRTASAPLGHAALYGLAFGELLSTPQS